MQTKLTASGSVGSDVEVIAARRAGKGNRCELQR